MLGNSEKVSKLLEFHFIFWRWKQCTRIIKAQTYWRPVLLVVCASHSNAIAERLFSQMNWLKQHGGSNKTMAAWTLLAGHYPSADYPSRLTAQKMRFSIKDFFSKAADLVTFTDEILNGKLHFLCSNFSQRKSPKIGKSLVQHQGTSTQARQTQGVQINRN